MRSLAGVILSLSVAVGAQIAAPPAAAPSPACRPSCPATALPNAPSYQRPAPPVAPANSLVVAPGMAFQPLSRNQKFHLFVRHTYSPYTFVSAAYDATYAQATGDPRDYGGGMEGWGKRLGAAAAGTETRSFFGTFLFPMLLHQDPRYFAQYQGRSSRG